MKRLFVLSLFALMLLFPCSTYATDTALTTVNCEYTLDMWHHSGGYWKVGNLGSDKISVTDAEMAALGGIEGYLEDSESACFEINLPDMVRSAFESGKDVRWELVSAGEPLERIFNTESLTEVNLTSTKLTFSIKPRFNVNSGYTMNDFVSGLKTTIPLIDREFGYNAYAIYGKGQDGIQFDGRFYASESGRIVLPFIHPLMIEGSSGKLKSGYDIISGNGTPYSSEGLRIGEGTFSSGGACGLSFSFPVGIRFYIHTENEDGGEGGGEGGSGGISGGDPEEHNASVEANLDLPSETYEGHSVEAVDCSRIDYDGETYSAEEAYKKGIASHSISVSPSEGVSNRKKSRIENIITFDCSGTYSVKLKVNSLSASDSDTKSIVVKRCPYIMASIGGLQKQNRRQIVSGSVAQNPKYPIVELTLIIMDEISGERITVRKHLDGSTEDVPENSANIKYRTIVDNGSDEFYVRFVLEFLSKFSEDRYFNLEIYARDTRGNIDTYNQKFLVVKDNPPVAAIDIKDRFYRAKGGGAADIEVKDASISDGDKLVRSWWYSADGTSYSPIKSYEDLSFGSLQDISFKRADVGWFKIRLSVRDDWKDDTLPEYVSDADYLSSSTEASSMVDNIAPNVSLSLSSMKTAEILLLAKDDAAMKSIKASKDALKMKLLESGIDAKIYIASTRNVSSVGGKVSTIGSKQNNFGFQGRWPFGNSFWEMYSASADEDRLYVASCSWPVGSDIFDCYASQPYVITAYDKNSLNTLWTFTLSDAFFKVSFDQARYGHDFEGRYLYITAEGKTILIEKSTGAYVAVINGTLGFNNSVTEKNIYAYKSDGIYRYPRSGGAAKKIVSGTFFTDADKVSQFGGKVSILLKNGSRTYVAHFDPESENVSYTYLQGTGTDQNTSSTTMLGFDSSGVTLINVDSQVRVFDSNGALIKTLPGGKNADPVFDSSGKINYISVRSDSYYSYKGDEAYYATVSVYGIYNTFSSTQTIVSEYDYPTDVEKLCVSLENSSGVVYIGCGAWFDYVRGLGMPYGQRFRVFVFNTKTGAKSNSDIGALSNGLASSIEWGYQTQGSIVLTVSYNIPTGGYSRTYLLSVTETGADRLTRLKNRYLSYKADFSVVREIGGSLNMSTLAEQIVSETNSGQKSLQIKGNSQGSGISKNIIVEPGKTYYYEYDTNLSSDVMDVNAKFSRNGSGNQGYVVKKEYFEDFNDTDYESEIKRVSGKVNKSAYYMVDVSGYGYINRSGSISFTVPSGYYGVISFDYSGKSSRGNGYSYFTLSKNGGSATWWEPGGKPLASSISGNYTWKHLLNSGNYVLSGILKSYSNNDNNSCTLCVDNFRLLLIQKSAYPTASSQNISLSSVVREQGNLKHVSGSFQAPLSIQSYGFYDTDYISGGSSGESHSYTVPSGTTAIYQSYVVNSSPYQYYTSSDAYRSVSVSWLWDEDRWTICASGASGSSQAQSYPASGCRITKYNLTGTQTISGNIPYRTSGNIAGYQIIQSKEGVIIPSNVTAGKFFLDDSKLYFSDMSFTGSVTVSLKTGIGENRIKNLQIYSIEDGKRVYLYDNGLNSDGSEKTWNKNNASAQVLTLRETVSEPAAMVYDKGEYVNYNIIYSDYESDVSKATYWQYIHTPYNDGLNPISNSVIAEPINRFYYDGKYELYHWQYDSTGKAAFDKKSNICKLVFYIRGNGSSSPWIKYIETVPSEIKPGNKYEIDVGVGDSGGKKLKLVVDLYYKGELIQSFTKTGLSPDGNGNYPVSRFSPSDPAKVGYYDIVATVSSDSGNGIDDYRFYVKSEPSLYPYVDHTAQWEKNRNEFNTSRLGRTTESETTLSDYCRTKSPRLRYSNVFWPEERFMLTAICGGEATRVDVSIENKTEYSVTLSDSGMTDEDGKKIFKGELWSEDMTTFLSKNTPKEIVFIYTAWYRDGTKLSKKVKVVIDYDLGYFRLHRKW